MATTYTEHYHFGLQKNYNDLFSMSVLTTNFESLDTVLYENFTKIDDVKSEVEDARGTYDTLAERLAAIEAQLAPSETEEE